MVIMSSSQSRYRAFQNYKSAFNPQKFHSILRRLGSWGQGTLYDVTENKYLRWRIPDQNLNINKYISACRQHKSEISKATSMFLESD